MTAKAASRTDKAPNSVYGARWALDPAHTMVEFAVRHLMISTVKGRFGEISGLASVPATSPSTPDLEVIVRVASLDTLDEKRDAHLRSGDFFDAEAHPTMVFRGRRIDGDIGGAFTLAGDLTIRGITKPFTLDARYAGSMKDPWGNEKLAFTASGTLNRLDYGLQWNVALETGGVLVGEKVAISIEAQFARQTA